MFTLIKQRPLLMIVAFIILAGVSVVFLSSYKFKQRSHEQPTFLTHESLKHYNKHSDNYSLITIDEAKAIFDEKDTLILDARPKKNFIKYHIPGAQNVEPGYASKSIILAQALKGTPIMIYCFSKSCPLSEALAQELVNLGYRDISVFKGGLYEWVEKKYPLNSFDSSIRKKAEASGKNGTGAKEAGTKESGAN